MAFPPLEPIPDVPPPQVEVEDLPGGDDDPFPPDPDEQIEPLDPDETDDQAPPPPPV